MEGSLCAERADRISEDIVSRVLDPYFPSCRYLKGASFDDGDRMGIHGDFSIPSSCYIESTGHFNAVEFVICFNQLSYLLFAEAIDRGIVPELGLEDLDDFSKVQLPNVFITRSKMSFRKIIDSNDFNGSAYVNRQRKMRGSNFYSIEAAFGDSNGGAANGLFDLAVV